jgi:uncharacterized protein
MILEGIVTTLNDQGELNVAPMGPRTDESISSLHFRPFKSSQTYANLRSRPCGVFHVVDDVLLLARAAVGGLETPPATFPAKKIDGRVLSDACRWFEFTVESCDDSADRAEMLEAAILATRVHLLAADEIRREFERLRVPVEKTAGPREREAFAFLQDYVSQAVFKGDEHA